MRSPGVRGIFTPRAAKPRGIVDMIAAFDYRRPSFQEHRNVAGFRPIRGLCDSLLALANRKSPPEWVRHLKRIA
jgi:hypothetical protein